MKLFVFLAAFAALVAVVSTQGSTVSCSDRTDIVLVLDGSESISNQDFEIMKNASLSFAEEAFRRINQLRIGAVIFGTDANTFLQLTNARNTAIQALNSIGRPDRPSTNTHEGIKAARNILTDPTSNRIMIVITDGNSNNPTTTEMEADSAKSDGIIIFTVGVFKFFNSLGNDDLIQDFRNEFNAELRTIASNPTQVVAIEDFSTLAIEITNLLDDVCIIAVTFLTRLFDRTAILGETVTLIARTSGTSTASFSWTKNGVAINNGLRVFYDSFNGEYRLVITNVEASDAGTYTLNIGGATTSSVLTVQSVSGWGEWTEIFGQPCSATCGSGVRPVTYVRTCLSLPVDCSGEDIKVETKECTNDPCPGTGAFFTVALNDVMVDVGQSFVITGTLSDVVSANYQWRRNGVQLTQDGRVSFNVVGSIYTLSINNAQASDAGRYTLTVGTQSSSADVTVNRRDFAVNLNNDTVSTGTTITLVGTLDNAVTDNFRWSRNGVQLSQGGRISFSVVGSTYTLTITGARQDDAGEYTLQVGSRTSTGFVNVLTNVGVCVSNMDVMLAIDGSSSIGRAAFGDTIIPALQGFVSGYFQSKTDRRLGYVLYSTEVSSSVPLSSDVTAINQALSTEALPNGNTYTDKALAEILAQFQASSRTEANKFAIVITDGKSDDGQATQEQGRLLKELNTTIIVVGVTDAVNRSELLALSSGPQYVQSAQAIADLADTLNLLIQCDPTWAEWRFDSLTTCNASCDGGYRVRTFIRDCQNASPTTTCTGSRTREVNEPCNTQACPQWSAWGADGVSGCSVSCGNGNRIRRYIRVCLNQTPTNNCEGTNSKQESETCFEGNCPAWSEWIQPGVAGGCSVSCGGGTRTRTYSRTCLNGGSLSDCGIQSTKSEQENCNEVACPVVWSEWSEVRGACSELCGTTGTRTLTRSRQCLSGNCQDETVTTTEACNRRNCLIFSNLVDVTVNEGRSQTFLTAQVVAAGVTGGQWFKGGVIVNDARFFATSQGVDRSLIISNVEMGDAGTYTYVRGNEVTQVRLVVVPIPVVWSAWSEVRGDCSELCGTTGTQTVTRSRQCLSGNCQDETVTATESCNSISCLSSRNLVDITVTEGTSASIVAQVIAAGVTGGQWVKDGQVVSGSRFTISSQGTNRILSINNIQMGDAGTYRFVLGNELTEVRLVVIPLEPTWGAWIVTTIGACDVSCGTGNRLQIRNRVCQEGNCEGPTEESSLIPCTLPSCNVCQNDLEVMLAIDSSSSIGRDSFNNDLIPAIKNFTLNFLDGRTDRKLGFVVYSTSINSEVPLSNNANTITSALDRLGLPNGDTSTDLALGSIIDTFNSSPASTNKIAIVITDGESSNPFETTRQGNILKGLGVTIVAVGIGAESTSNFASELRNLASSTDLVFLPENFGILSPVLLQIAPDCPVASWSEWVETSVSGCTVTCGGGSRTRAFTRTCTVTATSTTCVGSNTRSETEICNTSPCAGTWNTWGSWSTPTCPSCGDNVVRTVTRTRTCSQLAGQDPCEGTNTDFQTVTCDIDRCSGTWNTWGSWSTPTCPSCGDNVVRTVTRTRTCSQLAGQDPCEGTNTDFQTVTCDIERCLGTWNTWGSWSTPSCPSCGVNVVRTVTRTRTCSQLAGQDPCDGTNTDFQTVTCDIDSCIQATWQQWGTWSSPCPSPCSDNPQTLTERRTRGCDRQGAVSDCAGLSEESRDVVCTLCPVWRQWSDWTSSCPTGCSNVFINGVRTRSRICDTRGSTLTCSGSNLESLPDTCTFCPAQWSTWGSWTGPSCPDCGLPQTTRQTRVRNCNPFTGQPTCVGDSTEFRDQPCNIVNCRGTYGPWTQWSLPNCPDCGAPGIQRGVSRTRSCQKLMPTYDDCVGSDVDNKFVTCAIEQCDTGVWAPWSTWSNLCPSPCSNTPVNRLQSRNRVCNRATPTDRDCPGDSSQSQNVDCTVCGVGSWTEWTQWSPPADCPACGFNVFQDQSRSRQCITTGFESPCTGDRSQSRRFECQIPTCPAAPGPDNLGLCLNVRNISGVGYRYHPEDCDKYVQCYFNPNGEVTAIYRPCPFGHYWSQDTMRCDFSWRVNCPHERCNDTCVSTHNMEGSCRAYWSCEKGRSEAKCCPHFFRYVPGSGCQYDPLCQDPCPTGCSPRDACDKAPVWTDPQMFRVNVGLLGWMESKCINGSAFDLIDCGCSLKKPSTCKSEFDLNFDNPSDLTNAIGNWLTSESVKVEDGVAKFDGVGKLTADTKLSEAGVSCPFVLQFRYLRTGSGRTRQVMASSKDCTHGNTMVISQYNDSVVIELMSWFGPLMRLPISTKNLDPLDWKDFTLVYNGKLLTAMIRDSNYRVMAQFSAPKVLLGACGLHFGSDGSIMTAFEGQMDEIHLYKCDPGNLF